MGLPSRSSKLQVLPSPVRLTVMSIAGSCRKKEAAPSLERPKSREETPKEGSFRKQVSCQLRPDRSAVRKSVLSLPFT